jgi:hypothetical protein
VPIIKMLLSGTAFYMFLNKIKIFHLRNFRVAANKKSVIDTTKIVQLIEQIVQFTKKI